MIEPSQISEEREGISLSSPFGSSKEGETMRVKNWMLFNRGDQWNKLKNYWNSSEKGFLGGQ